MYRACILSQIALLTVSRGFEARRTLCPLIYTGAMLNAVLISVIPFPSSEDNLEMQAYRVFHAHLPLSKNWKVEGAHEPYFGTHTFRHHTSLM